MSWLWSSDPLRKDFNAARRGDEDAFARLYRELAPAISRYILRQLGSRAESEDLTSTVFLRAMERWEQFDAKRGSVRAWYYGIAKNAIVDHWRDNNSRHEPLSEVTDSAPRQSSQAIDLSTSSPEQHFIALQNAGEFYDALQHLSATPNSSLRCDFMTNCHIVISHKF